MFDENTIYKEGMIIMSKIDTVRAAMVAAMKAKDKPRKDALSMLLSVLKNAAIDKRSDPAQNREQAVTLTQELCKDTSLISEWK